MIVVDSSAWIEVLRRTGSRANRTFNRLLHEEAPLATTEVVVGEVLAGAGDELEHVRLRRRLHAVRFMSIGGLDGFERAARLSQHCRSRGFSPALADCLVAVPALAAGAAVLHADSHFDAIAAVTDLECYPLDAA